MLMTKCMENEIPAIMTNSCAIVKSQNILGIPSVVAVVTDALAASTLTSCTLATAAVTAARTVVFVRRFAAIVK